MVGPVISLDVSGTERYLPPDALSALAAPVAEIAADLEARRGPGAEFLGWLDLPERIGEAELSAYEETATRARDSEFFIVIGIGGSYLGARAVLEALQPRHTGRGPQVLFAGHGLAAAELDRLLGEIRDREVRLCVISKSGTTLEPAVAFRVLRERMVERYGREVAARRIIAITDAERGALRRLADAEGYRTFVVPEDVGGRFSVLTPVGLLPLAVAGVDVRALVSGAAEMRERCRAVELRENPAHLYAACRHALYERGFVVEVLSAFHPDLRLVLEWWKQLFGESEGKDGRGIFPASAVFTTDLHSLGQYLQDGRRMLLETLLHVRETAAGLRVPPVPEDGEPGGGDGLGYLVGRSLDEINHHAYLGTRAAHVDGGVPCLSLELQRLDAVTVGALLYMFEKAVAVSARLLGVNPFDQPGVEAYKSEMFRLLGRPEARG
ncbi:MAG: glucose-6-phosphate isomerase [Candidatus Krumholzibacteriia bacterium]